MKGLFWFGVIAGIVFAAAYITMIACGATVADGTLAGGLVGGGSAGLVATVVFQTIWISTYTLGCCHGSNSVRVGILSGLVAFVLSLVAGVICIGVGAGHYGNETTIGRGLVVFGAVLVPHTLLIPLVFLVLMGASAARG